MFRIKPATTLGNWDELMMGKKVLFTATNAMAYYFLVPHVHELIDQGFEVELACSKLDGYDKLLKNKLYDNVVVHDIRLQRNPFKFSNIKGFNDMKKILRKGNYNLICANEPVMGVVTRLCAIPHRRKGLVVSYTAHGFHFYKGAPILNWLIYYPTEKLLSRFTDSLITINNEDYDLALSKFYAKQNYYIPGIGVDTASFSKVTVNIEKKRLEIGIPPESVMLLSVGELEKRKNHETAIRAFSKLKHENVYYVICGAGSLGKYLKNLCLNLGVEKKVILLGFRKDIREICKSADVFLFPSLQEGLSVALMEAMSAALPCVVSSIRGNIDLINKQGGFLNNCYDLEGFADSLSKLIENKILRAKLGSFNAQEVQKYDLKNVKNIMLEINKKLLYL